MTEDQKLARREKRLVRLVFTLGAFLTGIPFLFRLFLRF